MASFGTGRGLLIAWQGVTIPPWPHPAVAVPDRGARPGWRGGRPPSQVRTRRINASALAPLMMTAPAGDRGAWAGSRSHERRASDRRGGGGVASSGRGPRPHVGQARAMLSPKRPICAAVRLPMAIVPRLAQLEVVDARVFILTGQAAKRHLFPLPMSLASAPWALDRKRARLLSLHYRRCRRSRQIACRKK